MVRTIAEVVISLNPDSEVSLQATNLVESLNISAIGESTNQPSATESIAEAVRVALNSSATGPASRFRRESRSLDGLFQLVGTPL